MTKIFKYTRLLLILIYLSGFSGYSQVSSTRYDDYKKQVGQMVSYFEYCLNLLGDDETDMYDKDVVINESYKKIFRDAQVQIEDDLDEQRKQPMNKNIQSYFKDVDFFFRKVTFKLDVQEISWFLNSQNQVYYKVSLLRKLNGTDLNGTIVQNTRQRYLEINLDEQKQDLKIVSYYTTKVAETEDLFSWWDQLPYEWKNHFGQDITVDEGIYLSDVIAMVPNIKITDSVKVGDKRIRLNNQRTINAMKRLINTEIYSLAGQKFFTETGPLSKFQELKSIDLTNSVCGDISALRACAKLEKINISHTAVKSVDALKYLPALKHLDASHSLIKDISPLIYCQSLENLNLGSSFITSLEALESLTDLRQLTLYNTRLTDLKPLSKLSKLQVLDLSKTDITTLDDLSSLTELQKLNIENTAIKDLEPLLGLPRLNLIYADGSAITREQVKQFTSVRPDCQVIFESTELSIWWQNLSPEWKSVFASYTMGTNKLSKEQLNSLLRISELDISQLPVRDLSGLRYLSGLKKLTARQVQLPDLRGLEKLVELEYLDLSGTRTSDYSQLKYLTQMRTLIVNETGFRNLQLLDSMKNLSHLEIEGTSITEGDAEAWGNRHPDVDLIYRSKQLRAWWNLLSPVWKEYFIQQILFAAPGDEDLHSLVKLESIVIQDQPQINDLRPLALFKNLKELIATGTSVSDFSIVKTFTKLTKLHIPRNPVSDFAFLDGMLSLRDLNLSSLRFNNVSVLESLYGLEILNLSNVGIKQIESLKKLPYLRHIDISNTQVKSLKPLKDHIRLETLICYNTLIKQNSIKQFQNWRPLCNVIYY